MASSGSLNTTAYSGRYLQFSWQQTGQNIGSNTTTISWTLKGAGGSGVWYMTQNIKVTIDGKTVYHRPQDDGQIKLSNGTTVTSGSYTFTHNNDGTRTFKVYVEAGIYEWAVNCKGEQTFTLNTIPRASQPSCITWPEHTQNVGNFGATIAIHMNRKSDVMTHTVRYQFGTKSGTIATGVTTGTTWKIPEDLMNLIPNSTSGSGTIYVDTYNGSTKIGTKSCGFTATVPASVAPRCTMTLTDTTGVDKIYGSPVRGLSKIKVDVTTTVAYSSPIAACLIVVDGVQYSGNTATSGVLRNRGQSVVTVTVTDKRGRKGSTTYTMSVLDYTSPSISKLTVKRCNSDGVEDDQGDFVQVTFSAEVSPMSSKNTATYVLQHRQSGGSWTEITLTDLNNTYTVTDYTYTFEADGNHSHDIELIVTDRHSPTARATTVSTAFTLFNCHRDGTGWRFGGVAEESGTLQNDLIFKQCGNQYAFSSIGAASTDGYILMARITVTATNSDTPITFVFSRRKAMAPMIVHTCFKSTADMDPGLSSIKYEGDNYDAYLTSPEASVWDLYVKKVSNSDTITLNSWFTSYRQMKRIKMEFVGSIGSTVPLGRFGYYHATPLIPRSILDAFMPVGYILTLYSQADPNDMYPGTTWVRMVNTFLWGCDAKGDIGVTGGEKAHTLTVNELPSHTHGSVYSGNASGTKSYAWLASGGSAMAYGAVSTGGGAAHNNMPPYTQVAFWRRTA